MPFNMHIDVEDKAGILVHGLRFEDAITIIPPDAV
jgi:hypothetical protein